LAGLRVSEAIGIRFCDLGNRWITVVGKGARKRTVLVPTELVDELRYQRWRTDLDDSFVFKGQSGRPISSRFARRLVRRASEEAIGKPASPHWFRHSHATHAVEGGAPLHVVQNSLGHRSLNTTAGYLHARPSQGSSQYLALP
jgi:integrase/recombinase XerD